MTPHHYLPHMLATAMQVGVLCFLALAVLAFQGGSASCGELSSSKSALTVAQSMKSPQTPPPQKPKHIRPDKGEGTLAAPQDYVDPWTDDIPTQQRPSGPITTFTAGCVDNTEVTYRFPAKADTTPKTGYWYVTNDHGTDARDLNIKRWMGSGYTRLRPGAPSGSKVNSDYLIYDTPIHALGDGEVIACWRNAPDNPAAGTPHPGRDGCDGSCDQWPNCSCTVPRSGNFVAIKTATGEILHHAHFKPGSVPAAICPHNAEFVANANAKPVHEGAYYDEIYVPPAQRAKVKKGDLIGRGGNAGASSGPHLHIHRKPGLLCPDSKPIRLTGARYQDTGNAAPGNVWINLYQQPLSAEGTKIIYDPY